MLEQQKQDIQTLKNKLKKIEKERKKCTNLIM